MVKFYYGKVRKLITGTEGATLVEYGLLVALIAVVCIGAITVLGGSINTMFGNLGSAITDVNTP